MIDHQAALIYTMVLVSAADSNMTDAEMRIIGDNVRDLPVFADYNRDNLTLTLRECAGLLEQENGLEEAFRQIKAALPAKLRETAYAMACDVAAADGEASQEELRVLELLRHRLSIDRLIAAAIERGTRARFMTS
ncbi:MAG TPA: tellurite resistance TerB family protein [Stellaceae bacterium]|nr:tellurite resistance TerB family protein [Stellaceae bacterium]